MTSKSSTQLISASFAFIFVSIIVVYGILQNQKTSTETSLSPDTVATVSSVPAADTASPTSGNTPTTSNSTSAASVPPADIQTKYRDGTYTASSTYRTPGSPREPLTVKLSIQNDRITSVSSSPDSSDEQSAAYKLQFSNAISGMLVGKNLDEKSPNRLNGSSLTSAGFNIALSAIRTEASK